MKFAFDTNGKQIQVPENTPVRTVDGAHYLLNDKDREEIKQREDEWKATEKDRLNKRVVKKRLQNYGSAEEQLEYAIENGWDALVARNKSIKEKYPKEG
jgi:hypothetical protein